MDKPRAKRAGKQPSALPPIVPHVGKCHATRCVGLSHTWKNTTRQAPYRRVSHDHPISPTCNQHKKAVTRHGALRDTDGTDEPLRGWYRRLRECGDGSGDGASCPDESGAAAGRKLNCPGCSRPACGPVCRWAEGHEDGGLRWRRHRHRPGYGPVGAGTLRAASETPSPNGAPRRWPFRDTGTSLGIVPVFNRQSHSIE